jgi:hypothetical protein
MNRTIKFRAKDPHGKWVYGSLVSAGMPDVDPAIYFPHKQGSVTTMRWVYVDKDSIGQFTSLYDMDHKEIYEGDILQIRDGSDPIEVRFVRGIFAFLINGDYDDELITNASTHEWAKIIGNIHDNPKMIKR